MTCLPPATGQLDEPAPFFDFFGATRSTRSTLEISSDAEIAAILSSFCAKLPVLFLVGFPGMSCDGQAGPTDKVGSRLLYFCGATSKNYRVGSFSEVEELDHMRAGKPPGNKTSSRP
jgi:hypothetical protein